jgi:hypothetical protein
VLGADVLVIAAMRFFSRLDQRTADPVCKIVASQKILLVVAKRFICAVDIASTRISALGLLAAGRISET